MEGFETKIEEMKKVDAKNNPEISGAFWDKYPEIVKVYNFISKNKNEDGEIKYFSRELCGGPHVEDSDSYASEKLKNKRFKIIKQENVSAGVRRFKAVLE
jgi:alanyl-tRNA synthetase